MQPDPDRLIAALSALAGGCFWGLFHFATAVLSGQPVGATAIVLALANVLVGIVGGTLLAYFVGPAVAAMIPVASLRDLHTVGFGIGAGAWEAAPFAYRWLRRWAAAKAEKEA